MSGSDIIVVHALIRQSVCVLLSLVLHFANVLDGGNCSAEGMVCEPSRPPHAWRVGNHRASRRAADTHGACTR